MTGLNDSLKILADKTKSPFVVAILGDSTATEVTESPSGALKTFFAAKTPERAVVNRNWSVADGKLGDQTIWQQGSGTPGISPGTPGGGGTSPVITRKTVLSESFNRGGPLTGAELIGSTPETGGAWTGPTGWYRTYNNTVMDVVPGTTPDFTIAPEVRHTAHAGTDGKGGMLMRLDGSKATVYRSTFHPFRGDKATVYLDIALGNGGIAGGRLRVFVAGEEYPDDENARTLATFDNAAFAINGIDQFVDMSMTLTGTSVTATIKVTRADGQALPAYTISGTLTAEERTALNGWNRSAVSSNDPRFRGENLLVAADVSSTGGGTATTQTSTPGSGPQAIVYNLSIDGSTLDAQLDILAAGLPLKPHLVIIQHGLNYGADTPTVYLEKMATGLGVVRDFAPSAEFMFVIENPRFPMAGVPASRVTDHAARNLALPPYLKLGNIAYADTFADWTALADGGASLVIDDKHPNTAGRLRQNTVVRAVLDDAWTFSTTPVDPADDIPEPLTFGTIVWRAQEILPDGPDADLRPDVENVNGRVVLTPDLTVLRAKTLDIPRSYLFRPVELSLRAGRLYGPDGNPNVRLVASNSPVLLPTEMHWTARFYLEGFDTDAVPPVRFRIPSNAEVDLTLVAESGASPRVEVAVVDKVLVDAAVAKAVAAGASATTAATGAATSASTAAAAKTATDANRSRAEAAMVKAEAAAAAIGDGSGLRKVRPGFYVPLSK